MNNIAQFITILQLAVSVLLGAKSLPHDKQIAAISVSQQAIQMFQSYEASSVSSSVPITMPAVGSVASSSLSNSIGQKFSISSSSYILMQPTSSTSTMLGDSGLLGSGSFQTIHINSSTTDYVNTETKGVVQISNAMPADGGYEECGPYNKIIGPLPSYIIGCNGNWIYAPTSTQCVNNPKLKVPSFSVNGCTNWNWIITGGIPVTPTEIKSLMLPNASSSMVFSTTTPTSSTSNATTTALTK